MITKYFKINLGTIENKIKSDLKFLIQEEDTFGLNDSDWDVYKQISRDAEESDSEEETLKAQV